MVPNQNAVADMGKTKQNKTRPLIGCTYRYDFNTLKPHARQRERGSSCCKSCSSRRTDCSFFAFSNRQNRCYKALHLNSPRLKETRWAVQGLAGSRCRRWWRTRDKERSGLHAVKWSLCLNWGEEEVLRGTVCETCRTHLLKTAVSVLASTVRLTVSFIEPLVTVSVMRSLTVSSSGSETSPTFPLGEVGVVSLGSHWSVSKQLDCFILTTVGWHMDKRNGKRVYSYFLAAWARWLPEGPPFLCWSPWLPGNCSSKDPWG